MGSLAHVVPRSQSLILLHLAHLVSLVHPQGASLFDQVVGVGCWYFLIWLQV